MVGGSSPLVSSYMKRSKWKPSISNLKRATIITPEMVDTSVEIHNGCSFKTLLITTDHVGHRLGEFFNTRTTPVFKTKKKNF